MILVKTNYLCLRVGRHNSSRMVCKDGDPLCTIPMNTAPEPLSSEEKLRLPKRSTMNSKLPKWMVSPRVNPAPVRLFLLATMVGFDERTVETFRGNHTTNLPSWCANYWCFLHLQIIGSTRSCDSSSEMVSRMMNT
jgi:hypothetical protein